MFLKEVEIRNKDLEGQLSDLEQRLEKSQNEQEAFRNNLKTLLEILDGKIFELTELRDNLAKLLERIHLSRIPDVQFRKRSHRDINENSRILETNKRKLFKI